MRFIMVILLAAALCAVACAPTANKQPADLVLLNGGIYTVDVNRSWAEAAAIRDGRIIAVSDTGNVRDYIGDNTRVIDLQGRMAMPGLHDSHIHPLEGGYEQLGCSLWDYRSDVDEVVNVLRDCARRSDGEWFIAAGLDLGLFGLAGPDNSILDGIAPGRYIFVDGSDGHAALVNDKVLELAGIDADTPDPAGGVIERRKGGTEPSGTVRETARDIVDRLRPPRVLDESEDALRLAVRLINSHGITSLIDPWIGEHEMLIYRSLDRSGDLNLRVVGAITDEGVFEKHTGDDLERIIRDRASFATERINYDSVKIFVDGVVEGETAYLLAPYESEPHRGVLNYTPNDLRERVRRYYELGLQLHFHTIGDGAARAALDALEYARSHGEPALLQRRHTLAHLGLIDSADMARFATLNAAPSFTAVWATPDKWTIGLEIPALGQTRVERMYPIRSVHEAGATVVGGSDWNYGELDPLLSIETAVTRQDPYGPSEIKGSTAEAVDLATMIDAYTINGAWLAHREEEVGSIEVGKRADLVIYDRNLFEIDPSEISDAVVDMTIFDGRVIHERAAAEQD